MNRLHLMLFIQLLLWGLFYLASHLILHRQREQGLTLSNQWLFNISLLVETTLLLGAIRNFHVRIPGTKLLPWLILGYSAFWLFQMIVNGFYVYLFFADTLACFLLSFSYAVAIYYLLSQEPLWWRKAEFYMFSGIFLYFTVSMPYITAFGYLENNAPDVHRLLFFLVNDVLSNLRYGLLAVGFWLVNKYHHE